MSGPTKSEVRAALDEVSRACSEDGPFDERHERLRNAFPSHWKMNPAEKAAFRHEVEQALAGLAGAAEVIQEAKDFLVPDPSPGEQGA